MIFKTLRILKIEQYTMVINKTDTFNLSSVFDKLIKQSAIKSCEGLAAERRGTE